MAITNTFVIDNTDNETVLAILRKRMPDELSWSSARKLLSSRLIAIGGVLCVDEARRLTAGEVVTVNSNPYPAPPTDSDVKICHVDSEIVVAEKPSGMITLRRNTDLNWSWARKNLQPTLDECVPRLIGEHAAKKNKSEKEYQHLPKLFPVHRIDRDSSGLLVFARNEEAQTNIIGQFARHKAVRTYLALIPGEIEDQTVTSQFIRDRGDGLRGSTTDTSIGQSATTHFKTLRKFAGEFAFSEVECSLETGRTNQIRIHLAELGHPICGDIKYRGPFGLPPVEDQSRIKRMALHASELKIKHPASGDLLEFKTLWPKYIVRFLEKAGKA